MNESPEQLVYTLDSRLASKSVCRESASYQSVSWQKSANITAYRDVAAWVPADGRRPYYSVRHSALVTVNGVGCCGGEQPAANFEEFQWKRWDWEMQFKVCKSVHHHTIPINQPTRCKNFQSLLLDVYVRLNIFRASSNPLSGAQQLQ